MGLGHGMVIAVEERQKIFRKVAFIRLFKVADDSEIYCYVTTVGFHHNVAGVHIGVEEIVVKDLLEKYLHPTGGEFFQINPRSGQGVDIVHRQTADPLHHQHINTGVVPVNFGNIEIVVAVKITPNLVGIGGFADHVELIENGGLVISDYFNGP